MNCKAQTSIEMLLVLVIVFTLSIAVIGLFFSVERSTIAMIVAKNAILEQLNDKEEIYLIKSITISKEMPSEIELTVNIEPDTSINADDVRNKVMETAGYSEAKIIVV